MPRGLPAWPTTSTALPTRTETGSGLSSASSVMRKRGYMAETSQYSIQCDLSSTTVEHEKSEARMQLCTRHTHSRARR